LTLSRAKPSKEQEWIVKLFSTTYLKAKRKPERSRIRPHLGKRRKIPLDKLEFLFYIV
jgi:hypothetical protein